MASSAEPQTSQIRTPRQSCELLIFLIPVGPDLLEVPNISPDPLSNPRVATGGMIFSLLLTD